jgi:signal transduction histidine kinase
MPGYRHDRCGSLDPLHGGLDRCTAASTAARRPRPLHGGLDPLHGGPAPITFGVVAVVMLYSPPPAWYRGLGWDRPGIAMGGAMATGGLGLRRRDVAVAGLAVVVQSVAPQPGSVTVSGPWWHGLIGLCLLLVQGAALPWRRGHPVPVAAVVVVAFAASAFVAVNSPVCAWVALFNLAIWVEDSRRAAVVVPGAVVAVSAGAVAAELTHSDEIGFGPLLVVLTVLVTTAGGLVRAQRGRREALVRAHAAATRQAAVEERLRVARDLHDLVGHGLATLAVQSSTARLALDAGEVAVARDALAAVEAASRATMREMRQLLGVLRRVDGDGGVGGDALEPSPGLDDVPLLVDQLRRTGVDLDLRSDIHVDVDVDVDVDTGGDGRDGVRSVPPAVGLCAYRIVQESLTNAVKHAPGSQVGVHLSAAPGELAVQIINTPGNRRSARTAGSAVTGTGIDTGTRTDAGDAFAALDRGGGRGLTGLRERVAAVGGTFAAGPTYEGGWRVSARLRLPDPRGAGGGAAERAPTEPAVGAGSGETA